MPSDVEVALICIECGAQSEQGARGWRAYLTIDDEVAPYARAAARPSSMASAWVERRQTRKSGVRHVVRYRIGGRESVLQFGGSFKTQREARIRRDLFAGELAALRVPDVRLVERQSAARTVASVAAAWRESRVDVSAGTAATHAVNLGRILPRLGQHAVDRLEPADVVALVASLNAEGLARESIRKTVSTLAQVLTFAGVEPNPARNRVAVRLPREDRTEIQSPTAAHLLAVLPRPSISSPLPG